jgi:hypothetical protein
MPCACSHAAPSNACLARGQVLLAQQAASVRREAGVEKPLGAPRCRPVLYGRGQGVHALDPGLGAEVFQVDPEWGRFLNQIGLQRLRASAAAMNSGAISQPKASTHTSMQAAKPAARGLIGCVHGSTLHAGHFGPAARPAPSIASALASSTHSRTLLPARRQFARQPPAHAQIAVVVDDAAEDVPEQGGGGRDGLHAADCPTG